MTSWSPSTSMSSDRHLIELKYERGKRIVDGVFHLQIILFASDSETDILTIIISELSIMLITDLHPFCYLLLIIHMIY